MSVGAGPHVLAFDWGWGHLQHHDQECEPCDGKGILAAEFGTPPEECYGGDDCDDCDGEGTFRWGSFYVQDTGDCDHCKRTEVPIAEMFQDAYVCLPCYVASHKFACGCDRWAKVEQAAGLPSSVAEDQINAGKAFEKGDG